MSLVCKEGASRMRSFCMISECTLFLDYIFARFRGCIQDEILEENGSVSSPLQENGTSDSLSLITSEMAVEEIIEQPIQGIDEHLVEFSEALRRSHDRDPHNKGKGTLDLVDQPKVCLPENGENGHCCGANGICNHEGLRDGGSTSYSESVNKKIPKKASFKLSWNSEGANGNQYKHDLVSFDRGSRTTTGRSSKQIFLKWDSKPQTVLVLTKRKSTSVRLLCCELVTWLRERNLNIYVTREVKSELEKDSPYFDFVQSWEDGKEVLLLHTKIDLVVTLGGDGTVIWAASLFKGPVPLVVPIAMGSLGFMTPFHSEKYKESLESVLHGTINITLRHRLLCNVIRGPGKDESDTEGTYLVLNEITIDRGISPFLTNLECSCDGTYMTRVQGDGLILSTTSGSTAYSLAAGGSMVHPQVPGILFTPICPHSLSFRPLILPEEVTLEVRVPYDSRSGAYASFDGKDRKELRRGDALICRMAPWPVPTACQRDSTSDFLCSIREGLHWNLRKTQGADGPPVAST